GVLLRRVPPGIRLLLLAGGRPRLSGYASERPHEEARAMADEPQGHAIDTLLLEERRYPPPEDFARDANARPDIYEIDSEEFWRKEAENRVTWFTPFQKVSEWEVPHAKWFLGGKLNVCFNCVDRHVENGAGDKVAIHWEGEPRDDRHDITFADLQRDVVRFANALKELGVRKGTPVAI